MMVSGFGCCFSACSPVASDPPLLTNHLNLQHLALEGFRDNFIRVLGRLPLFAPSSLIGIRAIFWGSDSKILEGISESEWKAVDLALCDSKFTHLKSVEFSEIVGESLQNPHAFFQRVLPTCHERGILWYRRRQHGMYLIAIMLPLFNLCRPMDAHRSNGCSAIPWITSRVEDGAMEVNGVYPTTEI